MHLGPAKTGTTALALHLTQASRTGKLTGRIVYPCDDLWFDDAGTIVKHHALAKVSRKAARTSGPSGEETGSIGMALARIADHSAYEGATNVLFVAEDGGAREHQTLVALDSLLLSFFDEVEYVYVTRRQDAALRSRITQAIRSPRSKEDVSLNIKRMLDPEHSGLTLEYDYARAIREFSAAGTMPRTHVVPFFESDIGSYSLISRISDALQLDFGSLDRDLISGRRVHPTLPKRHLRALQGIKAISRRLNGVPGIDTLSHALFSSVLRAGHSRVINVEPTRRLHRGNQPWQLSERESEAILAHFAESNDAFLRQVPSIDAVMWLHGDAMPTRGEPRH